MLTRYPVDHRNLSDEEHLIMKVLRLYHEHHLTLEQLRAIPKVIGIATGAEKAASVAAVLKKGGYVCALVCDGDLARSLLEAEL